MRSHRTLFFAALMLATLGAGCGGGSSKPKTYPVSGKVTVDGKPLVDCTIQFVSLKDASIAFGGTLDASGNYSLEDRQDQRKGAEPGKYKVTLQLAPAAAQKAMMEGMKGPMGPGGPGPAATPFPKEFSDSQTSPKEVEVKAESNTIDITIP